MLRPAAVLLSLAIGVVAQAQTFTFRFAPPVDKPIVQTVTTTVTTKIGAESTTRATTERTELRFRKTDDGYVLAGKVIEVKTTGDEADNLIEQFSGMLQGVDVTYEMDRSGKVTAVRGFDAAVRKVREALPDDLPAEAKAMVAKVYNEELLGLRARAEWDGRLGSFTGKTVNVGDEFKWEGTIALPIGGTGKFYTTTTMEGVAKCGDTKCLRIVTRTHSDPDAMKKPLDEVLKGVPGAEIGTGAVTIIGTGERLINPATMNVYREVNERTIRTTATDEDGTHAVTRTEKKEYVFEYSPDPQSSSAR